MSTIKRKYIESHWLVFATQGILALLFGWYVMFTDSVGVSTLITLISAVLLCFGVIEVLNLVHRRSRQHDWGIALGIALIEVCVAIALFIFRDTKLSLFGQEEVYEVLSLTILAGYTVLRGFFEILIASKSLTDPTDRFIWIISGISGVILGFIILNAGHLSPTTFVKIFGTFMMIYGLTNLVYGIHSKNEKTEAKALRAAAQKSTKTKKKK